METTTTLNLFNKHELQYTLQGKWWCNYSALARRAFTAWIRSSRSKMGLSRIAPTCLNMRRITPPRASPTFNTAPLIDTANPETTPRFHLRSYVLSCRKAQIALGPFTVKSTSCFLMSWYHYDDSVNKHYRMDRIAAERALGLKISTAGSSFCPNRRADSFKQSLCRNGTFLGFTLSSSSSLQG